MLRLLLSRVLLVALPFGVYFLWREAARRSGREMGATPWGWLVGAGLALAGLSLMATVAFHHDNRGEGYVPAEAHPGGAVTPGSFDPSRRPPPASEASPNTAP
ncbi:MAG TPA: hypothetical protein VL460_08410 [Caulobacteraceae bacterium]|nr:hypothetical protein [Caulobacteraceae bacterium]